MAGGSETPEDRVLLRVCVCCVCVCVCVRVEQRMRTRARQRTVLGKLEYSVELKLEHTLYRLYQTAPSLSVSLSSLSAPLMHHAITNFCLFSLLSPPYLFSPSAFPLSSLLYPISLSPLFIRACVHPRAHERIPSQNTGEFRVKPCSSAARLAPPGSGST